jgi:hypothetical protein
MVDGVEYSMLSDTTKACGLLDTHYAAVTTIAEILASHLHTPQWARVLLLLVCTDMTFTSWITLYLS